MATQRKKIRGTTSEHSTFVGAEGVISYDTTLKALRVHDNSTAGGFVLAKMDDLENLAFDNSGTGLTANTISDAIVELASANNGNVFGPASASNNSVALFSGTSGKLLKNGYALSQTPTANTIPLPDSNRTLDNWITREIEILVSDPNGDAITTGDLKAPFTVSLSLNGWDLIRAEASLTTPSSSGVVTIQIRNVTDSQDMLSTRITIDQGEYTSYTAATPAVINTSYDDVATGDRLAVDVDVAGTGAKGLSVILTFKKP